GSVSHLADEGVFQFNDLIQNPQLVGGNTFVTFNDYYFEDSDILTLHRIVNDAASGNLKDYPAVLLDIDDGYEHQYTFYKYETSTATIDPSGSVAQYDKVEVIPGITDVNDPRDFGYTVHNFYNGLPHGEGSFNYPSDGTYNNTRANYSLVKGLPYRTLVYNSQDGIKADTKRHWRVLKSALGTNDEGFYFRQRRVEDKLNSVTTVTETEYSGDTGLATLNRKYVYDSNGDEDIIETSFKYCWEEYDTDRSENLLTPVIQTTRQTNSTITDISVATWQDWGSGKWAPHKRYQWKGTGSSNFTNWQSGEPSSDWLKTSEITRRDGQARVVESFDIEGIYSATKHLNRYPMARFGNSMESECSYTGFESGGAEDGWSLPNGYANRVAHSGQYGWAIEGDPNNYHIARSFQPADLDLNGKYIFSAWVKSSDPQIHIDLKYVYNGGQHSNPAYYSGSGEWEFLTVVCDLSAYAEPLTNLTAVVRNQVSGVTAYFDDMFVYPADAVPSATVYNQTYGFPIAALGSNGETMRSVYDDFQRNIASAGPDENVSGVSAFYYSRAGNNNDFNPSDPNSSLSVSARTGGVYDDFNDGLTEGWSFNSGGWSVTGDGELKNIGEGQNDEATLDNSDRSDYGVRLKVEHLSGGEDFGIRIGDVRVRRHNGEWKLERGAATISDGSALAKDWTVIASGRTLLFFAGGKQIFSHSFTTAISGELKLYTGETGTTVTFDDILVFCEPVISLAYQDGNGKER
ncbi:MAG: hypothetical protein GWO08_01415, partial [Gammaproteobacteria bacterium]|nr:hypothetical protein [Gammaproteobacteria bacterium]NIW44678.1 hypothetical protein [Gammaproteobacteria bacterium]NIX55836.1 hypothetical protein [candidate division Zixibacteria bacterium]